MLGMIVAAAVESFSGALHRVILRQKLLIAAAGIALVALVFLGVAWDIWLTRYLGPVGAAAATGVILLLVAAVLIVIANNLKSRSLSAGVSAVALAELLERELSAVAKPMTIAALIAGFLFAHRSRDKE